MSGLHELKPNILFRKNKKRQARITRYLAMFVEFKLLSLKLSPIKYNILEPTFKYLIFLES